MASRDRTIGLLRGMFSGVNFGEKVSVIKVTDYEATAVKLETSTDYGDSEARENLMGYIPSSY